MELSTIFKDRLSELKQRFVSTLPERFAAISATVAGFGDGDRRTIERLERQFHSLAGTAGTYDLKAIAAAAAEGEDVCAEWKRSADSTEPLEYLTFITSQLYGALGADTPSPWTAGAMRSTTDAWMAVSAQTGVIVA